MEYKRLFEKGRIGTPTLRNCGVEGILAGRRSAESSRSLAR